MNKGRYVHIYKYVPDSDRAVFTTVDLNVT